MTLLMVISHVVPSGFHFDLCHDEEDHWSNTEIGSTDMGFIPSHAELQPLVGIANDCCADFATCIISNNHRHTLRRNSQTSVSAPPRLALSQPIATILLSINKTGQHHLPTQVHSKELPVLRTIIIQV